MAQVIRFHSRKAIEIAFRRWLSGQSPSRWLVEILREQSRDVYRSHLSARFSDGMTWANYGTFWQADHIVPLCTFDLSDPYEVRLAWSLDNLRPMTCAANRARGASVADALCALASRAPIDGVEYSLLRGKVEPEFRRSYPAITLSPAA